MVWVRVGRDVGQRLECRYGMFIEIWLGLSSCVAVLLSIG